MPGESVTRRRHRHKQINTPRQCMYWQKEKKERQGHLMETDGEERRKASQIHLALHQVCGGGNRGTETWLEH